MGDEIAWFHEDDYLQIELLPNGAEDFAKEQAAEIADFSKAHQTEEGFWTDMYICKDPPVSLDTLRIPVAELELQALGHLKRFRGVTTGYSSHVEHAERTMAWGADGMPLVFADYGLDGLVRNIWLSYMRPQDVEPLATFLCRCARRWPLILADWGWGNVIDLSDDAAVLTYLGRRTGTLPQ
jgi:hypothetical protein